MSRHRTFVRRQTRMALAVWNTPDPRLRRHAIPALALD
jgi:hypothetical protein